MQKASPYQLPTNLPTITNGAIQLDQGVGLGTDLTPYFTSSSTLLIQSS